MRLEKKVWNYFGNLSGYRNCSEWSSWFSDFLFFCDEGWSLPFIIYMYESLIIPVAFPWVYPILSLLSESLWLDIFSPKPGTIISKLFPCSMQSQHAEFSFNHTPQRGLIRQWRGPEDSEHSCWETVPGSSNASHHHILQNQRLT